MINTEKYWDDRFRSGDWESNKGQEQTLFHYNILLEYMPEWLKNEISDNKMSICDLGCGMGEGVDLFKRYFKDSEVVGVDFSNYAIKEAKKEYSDASFTCSDITKFERHYDVIVSSHTLEHFKNPYKLLSNIINLADKYFILIIPFREENLFKEHFNSFDYNFFPVTIQNHKLVHFKEIDKMFFDPGKYWAKEQILVVYANTKNLDIGKFSLKQLNNSYFDELKITKESYEDKINELNNQHLDRLKLTKENHKDIIHLLEHKYSDELKITKENYEDKINELNNQHLDELKAARENYKDIINSYKQLNNLYLGELKTTKENYKNIISFLEHKYSDELKITKENYEDKINELNNQHLDELKTTKENYKDKINSYKQLNTQHLGELKTAKENYKDKISSLEYEYLNDLKTTKKSYEDKINELNNQVRHYQENSESSNQKINDLTKENKKTKSNLFYEQKSSEKLKQQINDLMKKNTKTRSHFLYEQRKCEQLIKENRAYKSRKMVRFADRLWKFYHVSKLYSRDYSYIAINEIYGKLKRFSKITTLIHKTNNKFNIIDKEAALETYKKHQNMEYTVVGNIEPKINVEHTVATYVKPEQKNTNLKSTNLKSTNLKSTNLKSTNLKSTASDIGLKCPENIKVAVILDEFSYNCFKHEFNAIIIEPSNWLKVFETEKPDLFFCESAWSGVDSKKRLWKGQIYSSINFNYENRTTLLSILEYCKKHDIPSIFWNKEDPTHYDDKVNNFVDTALKFDHIFTTSKECVQRYKDDYGHKSVHCLMFAGQPKMFNPIEKQGRTSDIVFAGSWYNNHLQRCLEMKEIFDNILDSGYNLKIYDRDYGNEGPNRGFPEEYKPMTNPSVPFDQIEKVYKESFYSLNINTETKSKTMFARRAFELMLCNTLILSNYSEGMKELFGDNVIFVDGGEINLFDSEEKRINNLYNVLKNHTYSIRFKQLLNAINHGYIDENNSISIYYVVNDQSEIEDILGHYESIEYNSKKLVLLLSDQIPNHLIKNMYQKYANDEVSVYSLNYLLQNEVISSTLNKLGSYHGNLQTINELISNDTPYFVFANLHLEPDFIEKGILHYSYIEKKIGIALGDKFTFKKVKDITNVIFHNKKFMDAFNSIFKGIPIEFPVYTLQDYKIEMSKKLKFKTSENQEKDNIKTPDIDIHGSCVSRDIFNFDENKEIKLGQYFARQSFVSAISDSFPGKIDVNLPSHFQKRMVESDLRKDIFEKLSVDKANYLLIDFIDERLNLVKYNTSFFTLSDELKNSTFMENFDVDILDKLNIESFIWKNAMDIYVDRLLKIYDEDKIIIHEAYLVDSYITKDGEKKYFPKENLRYVKILNKFFKKYYVYLKQKLPNAHVISIPKEVYCSWEGHLWEKAPMHYENRYYQDVLKIIKDIIFEENHHKNKLMSKTILKQLKI